MQPEQWEEFQKLDVWLVYEYLDKAGPWAINGKPQFMSCQSILQEDRKAFIEIYEKIVQANEALYEKEEAEEGDSQAEPEGEEGCTSKSSRQS